MPATSCEEMSATDVAAIDHYQAATQSFQDGLILIESDGRKESWEWHLANGLLRLTQALRQAYEEETDLRKGFARSYRPMRH